jgi:hypothetical protein
LEEELRTQLPDINITVVIDHNYSEWDRKNDW